MWIRLTGVCAAGVAACAYPREGMYVPPDLQAWAKSSVRAMMVEDELQDLRNLHKRVKAARRLREFRQLLGKTQNTPEVWS